VDPDVLYLLVIAIGSLVTVAVALKLASSLLRAPRVFGRWGFCIPAGYAIAVASWSGLARTSLTGTGEGNLSSWVLLVVSDAPMQAMASLLGVDRWLSFWLLVLAGLLALMFLGITIDLLGAMTYGRKSPATKRRGRLERGE
jgi:hypothetical protein